MSDRTKTIIVAATMTFLIGGMLFGYYKMHKWVEEHQPVTTEQHK